MFCGAQYNSLIDCMAIARAHYHLSVKYLHVVDFDLLLLRVP